MHGTYIGDNRVLVSPVWGGKLLAVADDLSLTPDLLVSGVFEAPQTGFYMKHIKPGQTVVDCGANIGYFVILAGQLVGPQGRVVAYEANSQLMPILDDNVAMNGQHRWVGLNNKAVYSEKTRLTFHRSTRFNGNSSLFEPDETYFSWFKNDHFEPVEVEADSLDNLLRDVPQIDLLKIDLEGGELQAFRGMPELLERGAIKAIIFETNRLWLRDQWDAYMDEILKVQRLMNARSFTLDQNGNLVPIEHSTIVSRDQIQYLVLKAF